jgi:hypothetical protein
MTATGDVAAGDATAGDVVVGDVADTVIVAVMTDIAAATAATGFMVDAVFMAVAAV